MTFNATISDIAEVVMGQSPKGEECNSKGLGLPLLNGPTEFASRSPIPVQFTEAGKKFAESGDILFCVRGSTTGRMNYADQRYVIGRGIAAIRGKNGYPTPYVRAVLEQNLDRLLASATGSTFPNVGRDLLNSFEVNSVPPKEARKINQLLISLEYKIELNHQINQTLESMAQAIFKSWFVDFEPVKAKIAAIEAGEDAEGVTRAAMSVISGKTYEELDQLQAEQPEHYTQLKTTAELFPSAMQNSELGEIPKGWRTSRLQDLMSLDKGLSYKGQFLSDEGKPMVNLGCFLGRGKFEMKALKGYLGDFKPRHTIKPGDLVIANTDITQKREIIGSPGIVPLQADYEELIFTHHVFAARFHEGAEDWKLFVFFSLLCEKFRGRATGYATGTTVLALPRDAVLDCQFVKSPEAVIEAFNLIVWPIINRQWEGFYESNTLAKLRDTLLPKLLSGELSVDAAEFAEE